MTYTTITVKDAQRIIYTATKATAFERLMAANVLKTGKTWQRDRA